MTEDPAPYGSISPYDSPPDPEARLRRVFEATGCRTQLELAKVLGVKQSSISDAKKRGSIPAEWLLKLLLRRGVHPAWVLTGQGPRRCLCLSHAQARAGPSSQQCQDSGHTVMPVQQPDTLRQCSAEALLRELLRRALAMSP